MLFNNPDLIESVTLKNIERSFDERGGATETVSGVFTVSGIIQVASTEDEEVREGRLEPEDLIVFADENDSAATYFKVGNKIERNGKTFFIHYADKLKGHYELGCKRV